MITTATSSAARGSPPSSARRRPPLADLAASADRQPRARPFKRSLLASAASAAAAAANGAAAGASPLPIAAHAPQPLAGRATGGGADSGSLPEGGRPTAGALALALTKAAGAPSDATTEAAAEAAGASGPAGGPEPAEAFAKSSRISGGTFFADALGARHHSSVQTIAALS